MSMKQKIVIEVNIWCEKCRTKAMKVAAVQDGVKSIAFKGPRRDQMEIIGEGVDVARLAKLLRKKLGNADLLSVEEIKETKDDDKKDKEKEKEKEKKPCDDDCCKGRRGCHYHEMELHFYDQPSSGGCSIM